MRWLICYAIQHTTGAPHYANAVIDEHPARWVMDEHVDRLERENRGVLGGGYRTVLVSALELPDSSEAFADGLARMLDA